MADISQRDFKLANMADDLYSYTLKMCGKQIEDKNNNNKNDNKKDTNSTDKINKINNCENTNCNNNKKKKKITYRFPLFTYPNYVSLILETAGDIHKDIIIANESWDIDKRKELQYDAIGKCTYLDHLIRIAKNKKWISSKESDHWCSLINGIYWSTRNWMKSDKNRNNSDTK